MYCLMLLVLFGTATVINGKSKYYDGENRPYEFGYNIEGNQHRHESKDENGIIMGEFGFITADGVYHVTAYATDENGNFKILFMKNIKIGLPGEKQDTTALNLPKKPPAPPTPQNVPTPKMLNLKPLIPGDRRTCSGCAIPKKKTDSKSPYNKGITKLNNSDQQDPDRIVFRPLDVNQMKSYMNDKNLPKIDPRIDLDSDDGSPPIRPGARINDPTNSGRNRVQSRTQTNSNNGFGTSRDNNQKRQQNPSRSLGSNREHNNGQQSNGLGNRPSSDPGAGKSVGVVTDRAALEAMRKTLAGLLYKFNYTVGYHGHHEIGDIEGSKDGGYFFAGRDGLRRDVEYVANEFGYQPYLTQEQVTGDDVPREETEKQAGLKGYEFKWFGEKDRNELDSR